MLQRCMHRNILYCTALQLCTSAVPDWGVWCHRAMPAPACYIQLPYRL